MFLNWEARFHQSIIAVRFLRRCSGDDAVDLTGKSEPEALVTELQMHTEIG